MQKKVSVKKRGMSNIFIFTTLEDDGLKLKNGAHVIVKRIEMNKLTFRLSDLRKVLEERFKVKNQSKTERAIIKEIIKQTLKEVKKNLIKIN